MHLKAFPSAPRWLCATALGGMMLTFSGEVAAQDQLASLATPSQLKKLSLEELMDLEITSVSRRPEKLSETASAIQVITQGDIHRSGATSLPEALRLAPNLQVAQASSHDWAISARGFNNTLANKLLVMIDGRTIYTPLDAGVFWDAQRVLLDDIDRIEVVSGPGGTVWGANAVNGVINIITKSARDTQGLLVSGGAGSSLQDFGAVRYGGAAGTNFFYRLYSQRFDGNETVFANGRDGTNSWDMTQGGFRADWHPSDANTFTIQGDTYSGTERRTGGDTTLNGQDVLSRWTHFISSESDLQLQLYFDRTWRRIPGSLSDELKTYDIDFQHHFPLGERQSITWGTGYRLMEDHVGNIGTLKILPAERNMQLFSGFLQDEITLVPDRLRFTIGSKLEHNDYSGFEVQPSGRLAWTVTERQTIWAAVSRAVRSPSRLDADIFASTTALTLSPNREFDSEKLIAYEVGYHVRAHEKLSMSVSSYFNSYDDLRSIDMLSTTNLIFANNFKGETWGIELGATYEMSERWRLRGGYNFLHKKLWPKTSSAVPTVREGNDPQNQFLVQSIFDLPSHFQFDVVARYVDTLENPNVPSYYTCDARLAWEYSNWEIALVGQNLWDNQHPEFGSGASRQEIPRSVFGKITWRY